MASTRTFTTIASGLSFGESPRWHDDRVWFVDFFEHKVLSAREDGSDLRVEAEVPNQPSGLGWLPDGRLLVVSMRDRKILRRETDGSLVTHADLSKHTGGHVNDMVVDPRNGRAYVGNFGFDLMSFEPIKPTALLRVDPDGSVTVVAEDLWFPNGCGITPDNVLIVNETVGNRISAFDIAEDGSLSNKRAWAQFGDRPDTDAATGLAQLKMMPDGGCLDAEGCWWFADANLAKKRLVRMREGGEIVEEIEMEMGVFACMLGGSDGKHLFACVAPTFVETELVGTKDAKIVSFRVEVPRAGFP